VNSRLFFTFVASIALAGLGSVTMAQGSPEAAALENPVAATPESITAGQESYTRYCVSCHGRTAEGGVGNDLVPDSPDLTDAVWDHGSADGSIFDAIKNGVAPDFNMIPWSNRLSDEEVWNVVNYLRSLAK
jgi:mono/diheme cytochrome c family protein